MAPIITVHWFVSPRSPSTLIAYAPPPPGSTIHELNEFSGYSKNASQLGLEYEVKKYARLPSMLAPPELRQVHPLGKSPVITIAENGKTITLAESGAIVEYLIERFGDEKLAPAKGEEEERAWYLYWLHFAEGTAMPPRLFWLVFSKMLPEGSPFLLKPIVNIICSKTLSSFVMPRLKDNYGLLENYLAGKQYLVGDSLTGADIMMSYPVDVLQPALSYNDYPNLKRWLDGIKGREAYKKAVGRGGEPVVQPKL